ncbi:MAG: septal ring lytic transglycosylase RlpA family protein [Gammaproteobacteria bacterium]
MFTRSVVVGFGLVVLAGCSTLPPPAPSEDTGPESYPATGNPPHYQVFGERYRVMDSAGGYVERGVASWYGKQFHGNRTSNGEIFDMYALTAAHKTLPIPVNAEVKNLRNGKTVVVRINDRGPFVDNRLIDLSYAAARELGLLNDGTGLVEVRVLGGAPVASQPQQVATTETTYTGPTELFLQVGAFSEASNAERMRRRLSDAGIGEVVIVTEDTGHRVLHRVRVGPIPDELTHDSIVEKLATIGIVDTHLSFHPVATP